MYFFSPPQNLSPDGHDVWTRQPMFSDHSITHCLPVSASSSHSTYVRMPDTLSSSSFAFAPPPSSQSACYAPSTSHPVAGQDNKMLKDSQSKGDAGDQQPASQITVPTSSGSVEIASSDGPSSLQDSQHPLTRRITPQSTLVDAKASESMFTLEQRRQTRVLDEQSENSKLFKDTVV